MDEFDEFERYVYMYQWLLTICMAYWHLKRKLQQRKLRAKRRFGVRPMLRQRSTHGHYMTLFKFMKESDPEQFFIYTRMDSNMFDQLLKVLRRKLLKRSRRKPICPEERLAMTLKFLSQGGTMQSLAWEFYVGKSTAERIVYETCEALWTVLSPIYLAEPNQDDWMNIAEGFNQRWNFANCLGACDGKHFNIQAPINSGSKFYSYKKTYSIVLMAVCDHNYRFTLIDIGAYGSQSDSGIFNKSWFGRAILDNSLNLPEDKKLPGSEVVFPHFFVGDEAFPLGSTMMRPFPGRTTVLPQDVKVFNYRLSRARRTIENAFGILVSRWRIFRSAITANPEHTEILVKAAICLHNFIKYSEDTDLIGTRSYCPTNFVDSYGPNGELINGQWRSEPQSTQLRDIGRMGSNVSSREAIELRNKLKSYLMTKEGQVSWQYATVNRGSAEFPV